MRRSLARWTRCRGSASASSTPRFDLAKPRWEDDPTFDLDFHVRRYALSHADGAPQHATLRDLFQTIGPIYERPFDRTRPLWELIELDGPGKGAAIFFRLHHGVADGVGGNAILAALTDGVAGGGAACHDPTPRPRAPGGSRASPCASARRSHIASKRRLERGRSALRHGMDRG